MRLSVLFCFVTSAISFVVAASYQSAASTTVSASIAQSTACGDIIDAANLGGMTTAVHSQLLKLISLELDNVFLATDVYNCLISVPLNTAVATRFIRYYNDTIQFHSTLAYLKNPPPSYHQPAVDLVAGLGQIVKDLENGLFLNQYAFEVTLQNLIYSAHDAHLNLYAGILATFTFGSPYELASVSTDGIQPPRIYISGIFISNY